MKNGIKTSEFWVTVITVVATLGSAMADKLNGTTGAIVAAVTAAAYALSRGLAKKQ